MANPNPVSNLPPGPGPGFPGRPRAKPLTDRYRYHLDKPLERGSLVAQFVEQELGRPLPDRAYGRKIGVILADLDVGRALAGNQAAYERILERIEGKVPSADATQGLTVVINTNIGSSEGDAGRVIDGTGFKIEIEEPEREKPEKSEG